MYNSKKKKIYSLMLTGILAASLVVTGCSSNTESEAADITTETTAAIVQEESTQGLYTNGTYTGTGDGFGGSITVDVTIQDDLITAIDLVSENETPNFWEKVSEQLPDVIIESQSTDVDTISGATISSNGLIAAVESGLKQAASDE